MAKKGGQTQTVNTGLDPQSQAYVEAQRRAAQQGAAALPQGTTGLNLGAYQNPYQQQVIGGINAQYDLARQRASTDARQTAAAAGAFGDERGAVAEGARLGGLDRSQAQDVANLQYQGFNNALQTAQQQQQYLDQLPYQQYQQKLQGLNLGLGPTGQTQTSEVHKKAGWGDILQGAAGLGLTFATGGAAAPFLAGAGALGGGGGGLVSGGGGTPNIFQGARLGLGGGY